MFSAEDGGAQPSRNWRVRIMLTDHGNSFSKKLCLDIGDKNRSGPEGAPGI